MHCGHLLTGGPALHVNINAYGQPTDMCTVFASIELERALVDTALLSALLAPLRMQSVKASELQNHSQHIYTYFADRPLQLIAGILHFS